MAAMGKDAMRFAIPALYAVLFGSALAQPAKSPEGSLIPSNENASNSSFVADITAQRPARIVITPPNWATWRGSYSGLSAEIGNPPPKLMPGGNDYGVVSAVTGAIDIPASANGNMISGDIPGLIITSGVLGVARTSSFAAPAVGVYGGAHMGAEKAQAWGANFTTKNFDTSGVPPASGFNGQAYGIEVDLNLVAPKAGWAGSNADGMWITGVWNSKVDGQMNAVHIGAEGAAGWKNAIKTDHGSAAEFAEIGKTTKTGASPSQVIHLISSDGKADYHALIHADPDGSVSIKPNYYGHTKGLIVRSADPTRFVKVHPVEGIIAPSVATRALLVDLDGKGAKIVSVGPPDSCGSGQRCLSVPN